MIAPGTRVTIRMTQWLWPVWGEHVEGTILGPAKVDGYSVVALDAPKEFTWKLGPKQGQPYRINELRAEHETIRPL